MVDHNHDQHVVSGRSMAPPFPVHCEQLVLGMGCFWGAERHFWTLPGVWVTAVGYAGGHTTNPDYHSVCSGRSGHAEVVRVVYEPEKLPLDRLLQAFWQAHDPTQGMRQGNDLGSQYRSCLFSFEPALIPALTASRDRYQKALAERGLGKIATEIGVISTFTMAEDYHQQYLAKHPGGYCGLRGTGVCYS